MVYWSDLYAPSASPQIFIHSGNMICLKKIHVDCSLHDRSKVCLFQWLLQLDFDCLVEEWHSVGCSSKCFSRLLRVLLKKNGKDETPKFQSKWSQGAGVATCHSQELIPSLNSPQTCSFLFYNIHCSSFALNPFLLTLHLEMLLQTSVPFLHWEHLQWDTASLLSEVFEVFTGSL